MGNKIISKSIQTTDTPLPDIIEKEIDMGFFNNYYFVNERGVVRNNGCQRINYCSCDCNRCAFSFTE